MINSHFIEGFAEVIDKPYSLVKIIRYYSSVSLLLYMVPFAVLYLVSCDLVMSDLLLDFFLLLLDRKQRWVSYS